MFCNNKPNQDVPKIEAPQEEYSGGVPPATSRQPKSGLIAVDIPMVQYGIDFGE